MKNILTPKKRCLRRQRPFCKVGVAVGCWVLSLSTNYRDLSAIVSSAAPKKVCLFRHTSKTQGIGVGDRSRKMVLSRSLGVWSRFAQAWFLATVAAPEPPLVIIAAAVASAEPPLVLLPATVAVVLAFIVPVGSSGATATAAPLPPSSPELVLLQLRRSFHEELL